ncbi:phosphotransferase family protein [Sporichthya sp.]|uniref:phosphotransferase family protein n=1 Tax=Sporichthya sp. TaxID=65475 RepID=UPI0018273DB7|nr:phosphotransferase family protein [Sporichthya sp.]MBA3741641.1 phosphotransferase family protein [Sporichthya sp.]
MALLTRGDLEQTRSHLTSWLAVKLPDAGELEVSELSTPGSSGFSNETIFFRASWTASGRREEREFVARFAPSGPQLFPNYDLAGQFQLIKTLAEESAVPVPRMTWLETAANVFGEPFFVMERVHGRVPADDPPYMAQGWVTELSADERRLMFEAGLQALASVHAVDWKACGLEQLDRPGLASSPLAQSVAYFENYYDWARAGDRPHPVIDATFAWVRENLPSVEPDVVLNWGDARPGNLLIGDDLSVAAVLDWELACLGSRELDLGWWIFTQTMFSEGYGIPLPAGIPDAAETVAIYQAITDYRVRDLDFHVRYAGLRSALIFVRYCAVMIEVGALPPDSDLVDNNPLVQTLAKVMGFESTQGDVTALQLNRAQN